ncbi:MAG: ATP synthase F1 subunit gamma [Planctomycetes bacterium]|nr:ATP synthase F1 subunit gamma [Planctomycetota bacterium]
MASARDLRKKIRSISNTRKITRTMELVATSKAKRAQDRLKSTTPYSQKLAELLFHLFQAGTVDHPLLRTPEDKKQSALFIITGNRGLCGGYNTNVLSLAERTLAREKEAGRSVEVYMAGRKGINRFRFLRLPVKESYTQFDDRPSFSDAAALAQTFIDRFRRGEVDRVLAVSTRYLSAGSQKPELAQVLPIILPPGAEPVKKKSAAVEFIFEPGPAAILESLLPLSVKNRIYRLLVEAAASEQLARRLAMKRATDSAEEMIKTYTRKYNRSRQAGITQQINEIVTGAQALE